MPASRSALAAVLAAPCLAACLASVAWPFADTHLNEITATIAPSVQARIAELSAKPKRTGADKSELDRLKKLRTKLSKGANRLSKDLLELAAAGDTFKKLGSRGTPFAAVMDEGILRATIALNEREDLFGDTRALIFRSKDRKPVDAARSKAAKARASADRSTTAATRAQRFVTAETLLTKALLLAEKYARRTGEPLPLPRLRSGDVVGAPGARVTIPRGSGTTLDGTWILIGTQAISGFQTITIASAPTFVGGRDLPAGEAIAVGPPGLVLNAPATLRARYTLPDGTSEGDVAFFRDDAGGAAPLSGLQLRTDGTVSAETTILGTFQPGVQAPPVGAPDGRYVIHMFTVVHNTGTTTAPVPPSIPAFDPSVTAGSVFQEISFFRDHSGSAASGSYRLVNRSFRTSPVHHQDVASSVTFGGYEFVWASDGEGRFTYSFPLSSTVTAAVEGVASADGNVIAFTGRGGTLDLVGVGLRNGSGLVTSDLAGRWVASDIGIQFLDNSVEPFRTRWSAGLRHFDADQGGVLTFDTSETIRMNDLEYRTDLPDPVHVRTLSSVTDGGAQTVAVGTTGILSDASSAVGGQFSNQSGFLVLTTHDAVNRRASFMVAARQGAAVDPSVFQGHWNVARFESGATTGTPNARSSTGDFLPRRGTLDAGAGGNADQVLDAATRSVYTLTGVPPTPTSTWTLSSAPSALVPEPLAFPLFLDGAGNHRGGDVWLGVSSDGGFVLGSVTGAEPRAALGIVIGVK